MQLVPRKRPGNVDHLLKFWGGIGESPLKIQGVESSSFLFGNALTQSQKGEGQTIVDTA